MRHSLLKKFVCYTLALVLFLQPQIVVAAELISLERAHSYLAGTQRFYQQPISLGPRGEELHITLGADLVTLDGPLCLVHSKLGTPLGILVPTTDGGLILQTSTDIPLVITQDEVPLPHLGIKSLGLVTIDAAHFPNPLTILATNIFLEQRVQVDQGLSLWAVGSEPERELASKTPAEQIEQTVKGNGTVTTQGLHGSGSLNLVAGRFTNPHPLHLQKIALHTNLTNQADGDICAEDSVSVDGSINNDGTVRAKGDLTEKGVRVRHTATARVFAGSTHRVTAEEYHHCGEGYSGFLCQVQAARIWFGGGHRFRGVRLIAKATDGFQVDPSAWLEAVSYIELVNQRALVNDGRLTVGGSFTYDRFFELDKSGHPLPVAAIRRSGRELEGQIRRDTQRLGSSAYDCLSGVVLSSADATVYQQGQLSTTVSDIALRAPRVRHDGRSHAGQFGPASMSVVAGEATLSGVIEASRALVARVESQLTLSGSTTVSVMELFAKTIDVAGLLRTAQLQMQAQRVSALPSSQVTAASARVDAAQATLDGQWTGGALDHQGDVLVLAGQSDIGQVIARVRRVRVSGSHRGRRLDVAAASVVATSASVVQVGQTTLQSAQADLDGRWTGDVLHHQGGNLTVAGHSDIRQVTSIESGAVTLAGSHTGDRVDAQAGQHITFAAGSSTTLQQGASLQAPDKVIAGSLTTPALSTSGQTTHCTPSSQVTIGTLQSTDQRSVTLEGQYAIDHAHVRTSDLAITAPGTMGSLDATVSTFALSANVQLTQPSRVEATQTFANNDSLTIGDTLALIVPANPQLGSIVGPGTVHITAPQVANPEALIFRETGVQTQGGIHLTTQQPIIIERSHNVNHPVGLTAPGITFRQPQHLEAGGQFHSTAELDLTRIELTSGRHLSLESDGNLMAEHAHVMSDTLLMSSRRDGLFSGGTFSAPQMQVNIDGLCDTGRTSEVSVYTTTTTTTTHGFGRGRQRSSASWQPQQRNTTGAAQFLSRGRARNGEGAFQIFNVGRYRGRGVQTQTSHHGGNGTWNCQDQLGPRVIHHSDGPLTFHSTGTFDLEHGDLRASPNDVISILANGDINPTNVIFTGGRACMISQQGKINEGATVLTTHNHVDWHRQEEYRYHTQSQRQTQTAVGNVYHLSGGRQILDDGSVVPTLLQQVGSGHSITSQMVTINAAPRGLVVRRAREGRIQQTTVTLNDTFNEVHQSWGKGFHNTFPASNRNCRETGGQISADAEVINCDSNTETAYTRRITGVFFEDAQHVIRRSGQSHYSAFSGVTSNRDGGLFSSGGSAHYQQSVDAHAPVPVVNQVGHYIERRPDPAQPASTTLEGPVIFSARASTLTRRQVFNPMQQTVDYTSTRQWDNCNPFQQQPLSLPQFGSHPLEMLRGANQAVSQVNQAVNLFQAVRSGNPLALAMQIGRHFTNFTSSSGEERMSSSERVEVAPFLYYGRASFESVPMQGVVAGMMMYSPTGVIPSLDVRAPRFDRSSEYRSTQTSDTVNPVSISFNHGESWSRRNEFARGSQESAVVVSGRPDLQIGEGRMEGVGLFTVPTGGGQDFTAVTERVSGDGPEITYLQPVTDPTDLTLIPRPQGRGILVGRMSVVAPGYEHGFDQESGHSSVGVSLGAAVVSYMFGGSTGAVIGAALSGIHVGFGGEERHDYHRGTQPVSLVAGGASIIVEELDTEGRVTVGQGVEAHRHTHRDVAEIHTSSHDVDRGGQLLEAALGAASLYGGVQSLLSSFQTQPVVYSADDRRALDDRLADIVAEDERAARVDGGSASSSSSGPPRFDNQDPRPRSQVGTRGRRASRDDHRSTLEFLGQAGEEVEGNQAFLWNLSQSGRFPQPTERDIYVADMLSLAESQRGEPLTSETRRFITEVHGERYDRLFQERGELRGQIIGMGLAAGICTGSSLLAAVSVAGGCATVHAGLDVLEGTRSGRSALWNIAGETAGAFLFLKTMRGVGSLVFRTPAPAFVQRWGQSLRIAVNNRVARTLAPRPLPSNPPPPRFPANTNTTAVDRFLGRSRPGEIGDWPQPAYVPRLTMETRIRFGTEGGRPPNALLARPRLLRLGVVNARDIGRGLPFRATPSLASRAAPLVQRLTTGVRGVALPVANTFIGASQGVGGFASATTHIVRRSTTRAMKRIERVFAPRPLPPSTYVPANSNLYTQSRVLITDGAIVGDRGISFRRLFTRNARPCHITRSSYDFSRPLHPSDLGAEGDITTLFGTFSVQGTAAKITVKYISGENLNLFSIAKSLKQLASSHGAEVLHMQGRNMVNAKLFRALRHFKMMPVTEMPVYSAEGIPYVDTFLTIPLR